MGKLGKFAAACAAVVCAFGAFSAYARTVTYDGMLPVGDNWAVIAQGVPWLDLVTPVSCKSGGGWMNYKTYSEAYFPVRSGDSIFFECQVWDGGYVKCAKGELRVQDGKVLARTKAAALGPQISTNVGVKSMDNYSSTTAAGLTGNGYGISSVTIEIAPIDDWLVVAGAPYDYGTPDPAYGNHDGYGLGTTIAASCPENWTSEDGSRSAACTGWKLYRYIEGEDGVYDWVFDRSGDGTSLRDIPHSGAFTKLEWQWEPTYRCTASALTGGSVSVDEQWLKYGETFTVTATPVSSSWMFAGWSGDIPAEQELQNPLVLTVADKTAVTATFAERGAKITWSGAGGDARASNPANWEGGIAPMSGQTVVLSSGNKDMLWDLNISLAGWEQDGYVGTVTFATVYPDAGLGTFNVLVIDGDVTLNTGAWTHQKNALAKNYRLNVRVTGDMTIGPDATIQADDCGYEKSVKVNGTSPSGNCAGSYGGYGGFLSSSSVNFTYGSYAEPEDLGNGGHWDNNVLPAGGAIRLEVGGLLTHHGTIRANSLGKGTYYSGSGGSVYVITGEITGDGSMKADAQANSRWCGGGGRVAVKLTKPGADFSNYDLPRRAEAVSLLNSSTESGSPGTVYGETAADTPGQGWLVVKGNGTLPTGDINYRYADPFTFETKIVHFARLTLTNNAVMCIREGCALDLQDTTVCTDDVAGRTNGIRLNGGSILWPQGEGAVAEVNFRLECLTTAQFLCETLVITGGELRTAQDFTLVGDLVVKDKGVFVSTGKSTIDGSAVVENGGKLTTTGPSSLDVDMKRLELDVSGDLTIAAGGAIDVSGKGYSSKYPLTGNSTPNGGRSHGGVGFLREGMVESPLHPYGSIYAPELAGAGSSHSAGGGIILLTVAGTLTNDGEIAARGEAREYRGAGGSIRVTAGRLVGSGRIDASANPLSGESGQFGGCSGGGRIAVTLTAAGADFSEFPLERFWATGDRSYGAAAGAGTIYLRAADEAADEGMLVLRNLDAETGTTYATPLADGEVKGTAFGAVVITNRAHAKLADGGNISVKGDWLNSATFEAGAGSTVDFIGAAPCRFLGNTTFANLSAQVAGKSIVVEAGTTVTVNEACSFEGSADAPIELGSSEGTWSLVNSGTTFMTGVKLSGCQAANPFTVINGVDGGNNSDNIMFVTITPGETITWTGAADGVWGNAANWDLARVPISSDNVVVAKGAHTATLDVNVSADTLTVGAGASLDIGRRTLTVTGDFVSEGSLKAALGGTLVLSGDVTVKGTAELSGAEMVLGGDAAQTLTVGDGIVLGAVKVLSPALAVLRSLDCASLTIGDGVLAQTVTFAAGSLVKALRFDVCGAADRIVTLAGADGAVWRLNAAKANVSFASVGCSDASSGSLIQPANSVDAGNNVNWMFTDTRLHWDGVAATTLADDVVIDAEKDYTIADAREMRSLTVAAGGKLTVNAALAVAGSVVIEDGATLVWNRPGTIGGNLTILSGGVLSHDANANAEVNKISLDIAGMGYIQEGALVTGRGNGYTSGNGPGCSGGLGAGSHGGRGYYGYTAAAECYGSIFCPTNCGSGGDPSRTTRAGGAVRLAFGGDLVLDGTIDVNGHDESNDGYYTGAGGSVWLTSAMLTGTGLVTADGGTGTQHYEGGGGRISFTLTGRAADFSLFTGVVHAWGGIASGNQAEGSAGTVAYTTADGRRVVTIENNPTLIRNATYDKTDFPSVRFCDPNEAKGAHVVLSNYATLNLTRNYRIGSLTVNDTTARVLLNGHVLKIAQPKPKNWTMPSYIVPGVDANGNPGRIEWGVGLAIVIR